MLNKTSSFFFLQGVPAPCLCMPCLQRCCWSPWHSKPCTSLLTAKVPGTGLALLHTHSSGSVTQQGAANKSPHHGCHFYQVPLAFLELQAGVVLPPETGVPTPPRGSWTAAMCLKAQLFPHWPGGSVAANGAVDLHLYIQNVEEQNYVDITEKKNHT